ncbi:CoA transferase [Pseudonocardia kunmingensis]|uniref:CoA transferase n=1 Tax=Pseudonocardia kunmingensis TaxID=630975 RepID=UPI001478FB6C|nr:CoA transferase [Pseudonocardia kunmingensis]
MSEQRASALSRPGYGTFACADGTAVAIAAIEDHFWAGLVRGLGLVEWTDPRWARHAARRAATTEINAAIADAVLTRDGRAVVAELSACGVPVAPVLGPGDALDAAEAEGTGRGVPAPGGGAALPVPGAVQLLSTASRSVRGRTSVPLLGPACRRGTGTVYKGTH